MAISVTVLVILFSIVSSGLCRMTLHEEQTKTLSIKTKTGQVYNCVEFQKQPSFEDPSLNFEVLPNTEEIQEQEKHINFGLEGGGCPIGTVPILIGTKTAGDTPALTADTPVPLQRCSAVVRAKPNGPKQRFFGIFGTVGLYKPEVQSKQWSSSRLKISSGNDSIETGWMVNPTLFHDNEAHFYAKFQAGDKGCINTECPGFVPMVKAIPLGYTPKNYSSIGAEPLTWVLGIDKDNKTKDWVLTIRDFKYGFETPVGYWPRTLFTSLADTATHLEWGGEIGNPRQSKPAPGMGNGRKATKNVRSTAFWYEMKYTQKIWNDTLHDPINLEKFADCQDLYTVDFDDHVDKVHGRIMFFGGPLDKPPT